MRFAILSKAKALGEAFEGVSTEARRRFRDDELYQIKKPSWGDVGGVHRSPEKI